MGFDLYQICQFFVEFIPLQILKNKVWDLNKLDIQKHQISDLTLKVLEHVTLVLDMIIK